MFYRYAYLIILASVTFALVLARLSYTVTLKMTRPVIPTVEISRLITLLDIPEPRTVRTNGRNIILQFNPFIASDKKHELESLLNRLTENQNQGRELDFNVYLNEPSIELFNYMFKNMGNTRNLSIRLNPQNATINISPNVGRMKESFACSLDVEVAPPMPNFKVTKSTLTQNNEDENIILNIKYTLNPVRPEHHALVPLMRLDTSRHVTFMVNEFIQTPPQAKENLMVVQRLCNEALLKQGNALLSYVLFPVLTSELRGATFEYDLSNSLLKL